MFKKFFSHLLLVIFLFIIFLVSAVLPAKAVGPTDWLISIDKPTTWTLENSPYLIPWHVTVYISDVLIIEPGVVVKFAPNHRLGRYSSLVVNGDQGGQIIAQGTFNQPIIFTSFYDRDYAGEVVAETDPEPAPGDWRGIMFNNDVRVESKKSLL